MKNELNILMNLLSGSNYDQQLSFSSIALDPESIRSECTRILREMHTYISTSTLADMREYVQVHQHSLSLLIDNLQGEDKKHIVDLSNAPTELKTKTIAEIINLLEEIEFNFNAFWDENLKLPSIMWASRKDKIKNRWTMCLSLLVNLNCSEGLLKILITQLATDLDINTRISSSRLNYLELLTLKVMDVAGDTSESCDTWDLISALLEINFNAPVFYKYCCRYLISKAADESHLDEHYRSLSFCKKLLKQISTETSRHYHPTLPPILKSLRQFVQAEIDHVKDIDIIASDLSGSGMVDRNYRVAFTVKQLAFFIHLQVEAGIILEEKPKNVHKYITSHYSTKDQENLSEKSFKNAFYARATDDVNKVTTKVAEMLAIAQDTLN